MKGSSGLGIKNSRFQAQLGKVTLPVDSGTEIGLDTQTSGFKAVTPLQNKRSNVVKGKTITVTKYYIVDLRNYYFTSCNTEYSKVYRQHFEDVFRVIKNSKQYEPFSNSEIEKKSVDLGEEILQSPRPILVLDLDETLVHAEFTLEVSKPNVFRLVNDAGVSNFVSFLVLDSIQDHDPPQASSDRISGGNEPKVPHGSLNGRLDGLR